MKSLDPRIARLTNITVGQVTPKGALDQFGTFEVFVQPKEGKPFQHEGIVHAPELELAYVLAKEAFTRRFTCSSIYVADTRDVFVSPITEGNVSVYSQLQDEVVITDSLAKFEIYHLVKRGKQHVHVGTVAATSPQHAMLVAKEQFAKEKIVYNVWVIDSIKIRFTTEEEKELWLTLPEKKFRDAANYKAGDKLTHFLESRETAN
ncbi:MAG: phenylacetic acid degradation b [Flammeovirgaceae bacterium]